MKLTKHVRINKHGIKIHKTLYHNYYVTYEEFAQCSRYLSSHRMVLLHNFVLFASLSVRSLLIVYFVSPSTVSAFVHSFFYFHSLFIFLFLNSIASCVNRSLVFTLPLMNIQLGNNLKALQPVIISSGVPYLQITLIRSHSTHQVGTVTTANLNLSFFKLLISYRKLYILQLQELY